MATTDPRWKIYIFKKNSPWGVIKHPQRGNVYKHVVWPHNGKRNEFIDKELMPEGSKFANALFRYVSFNPINELSFTFRVSYKDYQATYDELNNSDFCAVKKPNDTRMYFYTLQVKKAEIGQVEFLAELDVFFTYLDENLLSDTRESFVVQGHEKRYLADGTPDWDKVLKNKTPVADINKLIKTHDIDYYDGIQYNLKWIVVYIKNEWKEKLLKNYTVYDDEDLRILSAGVVDPPPKKTLNLNNWFKYETSFISKIELPYDILLFPILLDIDNIKVVKYDNKSITLNYELLIKILKQQDLILGIYLKDWHELGVHTNIGITKLSNGDIELLVPTNLLTKVVSGLSINDINIASLKSGDDEVNDPLFFIGSLAHTRGVNINKLETFKQPLKGTITPVMATYNLSPILFAPMYYELIIKKWDREGKVYHYPRLKKEKINNKVVLTINNLYSFNPSNDLTIYWMDNDIKYKNNFVEGDVLNLEQQNNVAISQSQYDAFIRDNANSFNTAYKQKIESGELQRAKAITGLTTAGAGVAGSIAMSAFNPLALFGAGAGINQMINAGFNIAENEMRMKHTKQTHQATINDLKNRPTSVATGNTTNLTFQVDYIKDNYDNIKVLEYGLTKENIKIVLDHEQKYGYEVNTFQNVKKFIQTRKHYNYIESDDVFNDIVPNLSPRIKQIINDAFASGLYIWHYRSATQWKGIKNFSYDNDEV